MVVQTADDGTGLPRPYGPARAAFPAGPAAVPTAVLTGTSSDSHMWNLVYVQLLLEEAGYAVLNLGVCVPDGHVVAECLRERPDVVVVGTMNGHGHNDGARLVGRLRAEAELAGTPVVIGGKLGIDGAGNARHADALLAAGFDAVFEGDDAAVAFCAFLAGLRQRSAAPERVPC